MACSRWLGPKHGAKCIISGIAILLAGMYIAAVYVGRGRSNMRAPPMGHDIHLVMHGKNQYPDFLCYGAACTIICTGAVIWTYVRHKVWRVHPGPLIFYRSVADLLFARPLDTRD